MIITSLRDRTVEMLRNRPSSLTYEQIEKDTSIPVTWLKVLARGVIEEPGVNKIETLNVYLTNVINSIKR